MQKSKVVLKNQSKKVYEPFKRCEQDKNNSSVVTSNNKNNIIGNQI